MNSSSWIKVFSFTLTLGIGVALFVWFLNQYGTAETFSTLNHFGLIPFFGFVAISLANFSLLGWRWQLIINKHKTEHKLSFWSVVRHRMSGYAMSYLTPAAQVGGEPLRIALLHQDGIPLPQATSSVVLDVVFEITGFILYVTLGLFLSLFYNVLPASTEWIVGGALFFVWGILILFFLSVISGRGFFSAFWNTIIPKRMKRLRRLEEKMRHVETLMRATLKQSPRLMMWILFLSLITIAFRGVEVIYLAHFLGHPVGFIEAILLSSLPGLVLLIPIPSALGILEGSTAGIVTLLGLSLNPIALVLLIRFRDVIFIILGLGHMGQRLQTWLKHRIIQPISSVAHRL